MLATSGQRRLRRAIQVLTNGNQLPQPNPITITFSGAQRWPLRTDSSLFSLISAGRLFLNGSPRYLAVAFSRFRNSARREHFRREICDE